MAAGKSLAAQTPGVLTTDLKLPSIFTAPQEKVIARFISPYIVFAHDKRTDEWQKIRAVYPDANEGDMILVRQHGPLRLQMAKMALLCCKQYWVMAKEATGEVINTTYEEKPRPYKEHIEAVVLVYLEDSIVPANIQFRTTKCPAGKALADALIDAASPDWMNKSQAHKDSMVCQQPFARFFGEVTVGERRTSKTSGALYRPTHCTIKPTTLTEWRLMDAFSKSEQAQKQLNDAAGRYQDRLAEIASKLLK